jgi:hypothetical protein
MKKIFLIIMSGALVIGLASCENEIEPKQTSVMKMANEWWAQIYVPDGNGGLTDAHFGYQHFLTSNTASDTRDSLLIDDFDNFFELRAKVACDVDAMTFTTNGTPVRERYTDGTVIIENGRIFVNGGKSATGVTVDSLYFEAEFDWDPGQVYIVAGHARTGFLEDDF